VPENSSCFLLTGGVSRRRVCDMEAEPDAVFSDEQWAEIARTIGLATLPMEMKKAISQALFDYFLMSGQRRKEKRALKAVALT
jgi:hypothetical protein